ncbi:hypothetical protein HED63_16590 [Ochrobactrum cytisi]|nr:hypothetical protein [Brucella cytisi]
MAAQELIEEVATAIEQSGWEDVDVLQMNEVMAIAAIKLSTPPLLSTLGKPTTKA